MHSCTFCSRRTRSACRGGMLTHPIAHLTHSMGHEVGPAFRGNQRWWNDGSGWPRPTLGWRGVERGLKPHDIIESRCAHEMLGHGELLRCRRRTESGAAKLWMDEWREAPRQQESCMRGERRGLGHIGTTREHGESINSAKQQAWLERSLEENAATTSALLAAEPLRVVRKTSAAVLLPSLADWWGRLQVCLTLHEQYRWRFVVACPRVLLKKEPPRRCTFILGWRGDSFVPASMRQLTMAAEEG
jgi:hypothetical protein